MWQGLNNTNQLAECIQLIGIMSTINWQNTVLAVFKKIQTIG